MGVGIVFTVTTALSVLISILQAVGMEVGNFNASQAMKNEAAALKKLQTKLQQGSADASMIRMNLGNIRQLVNNYASILTTDQFRSLNHNLTKAEQSLSNYENKISEINIKQQPNTYTGGFADIFTNPAGKSKEINNSVADVEDAKSELNKELANAQIQDSSSVVNPINKDSKVKESTYNTTYNITRRL